MKNKDIMEWLLDMGIDPILTLTTKDGEKFLSEILEEHLKEQFKLNNIMERKELLIANYSQLGHCQFPEDTWEADGVFETKEDLLFLFKHWHRRSASNFSEYPFNGIFNPNWITFEKQTIIIDEDGKKYYGEKEECDPPHFLEEVKNEYKEWYKNIKERLPRLRKARDAKRKEIEEQKKLAELLDKYGHLN